MFSFGRRTIANDDAARCATIMRGNRALLVRALIDGVDSPRENRFRESADVFDKRVGEGLDLLIRHVDGEPQFSALYAGQRIFELHQPERPRAENFSAIRKSVIDDGAVLRAGLAPLLNTQELAAFSDSYRVATAGIAGEAPHHVRTLFVGDCMMAEIMSFLVGPLMDEGISIDPFPVNSRDPRQLRKILDSLAEQEYDVIFVSPFSHARLPELESLLDPARNLVQQSELDATVNAVLEQTQALLDFLSARFECPIFVHNAAFLQRSSSVLKVAVRSLLTRRACAFAKARINRWVDEYVAARNTATFRHLFVLDENALAQRHGALALSRCLHSSEFQHATVLSQKLASEYQTRIGAFAQFMGRKLVVCDLDNTLWDGVIGEGAVTHFPTRQGILKQLKDHGGVVLSIASKNDPVNVNFTGALLSAEDFVAPQISWGQKTGAIEKIRLQLNLQTKHMVFLDDRADERALVQEAFPDILTVDPADPQLWARMALWAELIHGSSDLDRTVLYRQQQLRDQAVEPVGDIEVQTDGEMLKKLGLTIAIKAAAKSDLKRIAELVNRTNQWNLCGSRTSFEEVRAWHAAGTSHLLIANAADRFGDMGTVCVAVVNEGVVEAEIPLFVLSCRVFGYGVESAMLREIARRAGIGSQRLRLIGRFRATSQNGPGSNMYADHGFQAADESFVWAGEPPLPAVPWAEVRVA